MSAPPEPRGTIAERLLYRVSTLYGPYHATALTRRAGEVREIAQEHVRPVRKTYTEYISGDDSVIHLSLQDPLSACTAEIDLGSFLENMLTFEDDETLRAHVATLIEGTWRFRPQTAPKIVLPLG